MHEFSYLYAYYSVYLLIFCIVATCKFTSGVTNSIYGYFNFDHEKKLFMVPVDILFFLSNANCFCTNCLFKTSYKIIGKSVGESGEGGLQNDTTNFPVSGSCIFTCRLPEASILRSRASNTGYRRTPSHGQHRKRGR